MEASSSDITKMGDILIGDIRRGDNLIGADVSLMSSLAIEQKDEEFILSTSSTSIYKYSFASENTITQTKLHYRIGN